MAAASNNLSFDKGMQGVPQQVMALTQKEGIVSSAGEDQVTFVVFAVNSITEEAVVSKGRLPNYNKETKDEYTVW